MDNSDERKRGNDQTKKSDGKGARSARRVERANPPGGAWHQYSKAFKSGIRWLGRFCCSLHVLYGVATYRGGSHPASWSVQEVLCTTLHDIDLCSNWKRCWAFLVYSSTTRILLARRFCRFLAFRLSELLGFFRTRDGHLKAFTTLQHQIRPRAGHAESSSDVTKNKAPWRGFPHAAHAEDGQQQGEAGARRSKKRVCPASTDGAAGPDGEGRHMSENTQTGRARPPPRRASAPSPKQDAKTMCVRSSAAPRTASTARIHGPRRRSTRCTTSSRPRSRAKRCGSSRRADLQYKRWRVRDLVKAEVEAQTKPEGRAMIQMTPSWKWRQIGAKRVA